MLPVATGKFPHEKLELLKGLKLMTLRIPYMDDVTIYKDIAERRASDPEYRIPGNVRGM